MFELKIKESVWDKINSFIELNVKTLESFFDDFWFGDHKLKEESCLLFKAELNKKIDSSIEKRLTENVVWERRLSDKKYFSVMIPVWKNNLFTSYIEDEENKTRVVTDIEFYKEYPLSDDE